MKALFLSLLLATSANLYAFENETICGEISYEHGSFFIFMNPGGGNAKLFPEDSMISKPSKKLRQLIGSYACVTGEWHGHYLFSVIRVN